MPNYITNVLSFETNENRLQEIYQAIQSENGEFGSFDFNRLIPMPESLNLPMGSITDVAINAFLSNLQNQLNQNPNQSGLESKVKRYVLASLHARSMPLSSLLTIEHFSPSDIDAKAKANQISTDELLAMGRQYLDNQLNYGALTWFQFCSREWGTKWPTSEGDLRVEGDPSTIRFDTAWSTPLPIIRTLSKRFPDVKMNLQWADEDLGSNVGCLTYQNGAIIDQFIPEEQSKEAYDLAFQILNHNPAELCMRYDPEENTYVYDENLEAKQFLVLEDRLKDAQERTHTHPEETTQPPKDLSR